MASVDTIIFRVNDLYENAQLVEWLEGNASRLKERKLKVCDEAIKPSREIYIKEYYKDAATGTEYSDGYRGFLSSANYDAAFCVDVRRNYVEFNVSLPKYYFGNNTVQLIDHYFDDHYLTFRNYEFWDTKSYSFGCFVLVFNRFLSELNGYFSGENSYRKRYIEIMRIDLCYNLVFRSESDALYYLTELKSVRRKKFSPTANVQTNYHSGIYYPSKDFTVKVYAKGIEFKATSKQKKQSDYTKVKRKYGQAVADRVYEMARNMLRYEVEFRRGYLTEIFYSLLKSERKDLYTCLNYSRSNSAKGYVSINGVKHNFDGQSTEHEAMWKLSSDDAKKLKIGDHIRSNDIRFMARGNDVSLMELSSDDVISSYDHLEEFNYEMYAACVEKFKTIFLHFQLGNYYNLNALNLFLKQKRDGVFKQQVGNMMGKSIHRNLNEGKLKWIMDLLLDHSWDEIKEKKLLPERSFYRYKKFCTEVGMKEKNVDYNFAVKFDYSNYYDLMMADFNYIAQNVRY